MNLYYPKKFSKLMTTSCLVCLFNMPTYGADYLIPLEAFQQGFPSTPSQVLALQQALESCDMTDHGIGALIDGIYSDVNLPTRTTNLINQINAGAGVLSTAITNIFSLIGQPTGNSTDSIAVRIGTPAQTDLTTTIGGSTGSLSSRLGDPGSGNTLVNNIQNGAASIQAAITTVQGKLASLANASLTPNRDLNRMLTDGNSGSTSGLIAKITGSGSGTLLDGIESIASALDGSVSGSITGTSSNSLNGKLATQIAAIKTGATQLSTAISDLVTKLGGIGDLNARATAIDASILASPTNVTSDIATLAGSMVTSPGSTLESNVGTLNTALDGTATGSTIEARINTALAALKTGATQLSTAISDINTQLGGSGTTSARITAALASLDASATVFADAITAINTALGGSGTTINRVNSANALLDGVQSLTGITGFTVTTVASNPGGNTVNLVGDDGILTNITYSMTFASSIANGGTFSLQTGPRAITFVNNSGGALSSAAAVATYLATAYPVSSIIKADTNAKASGLESFLGGSNYSALSNAAALLNRILTNPTGDISSDLTTLAGLLVASPGATRQADIETIHTLLNGLASGSTLQDLIGNPLLNGNLSSLFAVLGGTSLTVGDLLGDPGDGLTIIGNIGGDTTSVQSALNALANLLVGNTNFSSSLYTNLVSQSSNLDSGLSSLPGGATFATIGTAAASDGSGGVTIVISSGASGTYNLSSSTITGGISSGSTFTLIDGSNNLVLVNRSGSTISTQTQAIRYLASMYPVGSKIATAISDKISSLNTQVGGIASSIHARIAGVDAALLVTPTGVLSTDLATVRGKIVTSSSGVAETDINTINALIDGTTGGTIQGRIDTSTINGVSSNVLTVIGGSGSSIAARLGDPITGGGLSTYIRNNGANLGTVNDFDCSSFDNATNYTDLISAFCAIFSQSDTVAIASIVIPKGTYTDLRSILAALGHI